MKLRFNPVSARRRVQGFTLIESIVVIVLIGIVGGMVSVFMKNPIDAYVDTERRGELVAIADSASRFMAREIQSAVPNSVRITSDGRMLEFIPIITAGRYRAETDANGAGDPLDFTNPSDSSFDVLGPAIVKGNFLVIGNLGQPGISDVYATDAASTRREVSGFAASTVTFTANGMFPFPSPGSHFQIANQPVTYECVPGGTAGRINRYAGYTLNATQQSPSSLGTPSIIADKVSGCSFTYQATQQSLGLVTIRLDIAEEGETVRLQTQVNVDNAP